MNTEQIGDVNLGNTLVPKKFNHGTPRQASCIKNQVWQPKGHNKHHNYDDVNP